MSTDTPSYDLTGQHAESLGDLAPQTSPTASRSASGPNAYLIVHAESPDTDRKAGRIGDTPLQRLRALYAGGASHDRRAPLALTLTDRDGHQLLSLADAEPTLGVSLRPGTYHLSATLGDIRRGYTVSLPAGARFDLHLRFAPPLRQRRHASVAEPSARTAH